MLRRYSTVVLRAVGAITDECLIHTKAQELNHKFAAILESKIKTFPLMFDCNQPMPAIPADFPFTIMDDPLKRSITLQRELDGEKIIVELSDETHHRIQILKQDGQVATFEFELFHRQHLPKQNGWKETFMHINSVETSKYHLDLENSGLRGSDLESCLKEYVASRGINESQFGSVMKDYLSAREDQHFMASLHHFNKFMTHKPPVV